jgi:hypothetical protein
LPQEKWQVTRETGVEQAKIWGIPFIETSAAEVRSNVEEMWSLAAREILGAPALPAQKKESCNVM